MFIPPIKMVTSGMVDYMQCFTIFDPHRSRSTIYQGLRMSQNVSECLRMSENVSECLRMSQNVSASAALNHLFHPPKSSWSLRLSPPTLYPRDRTISTVRLGSARSKCGAPPYCGMWFLGRRVPTLVEASHTVFFSCKKRWNMVDKKGDSWWINGGIMVD